MSTGMFFTDFYNLLFLCISFFVLVECSELENNVFDASLSILLS